MDKTEAVWASAEKRSGPATVDICRVCRSEGTTEQPLFYPCLCSGSIKYIHQDCLIEWLKHSKKKYCELCKHPFTFSSVYAEAMPRRLPTTVLLAGLARKLWRGVQFASTMMFASVIWFLVVPVVTARIFTYYFGWSLQGLAGVILSSELGHAVSFNDLVLEGCLAVLFDALQGLLLTGLFVLVLVGVVLMREFVQMLGIDTGANERTEQIRETARNAEGPTTTQANEADFPQSQGGVPVVPVEASSVPMSPLSPSRRSSALVRSPLIASAPSNQLSNFSHSPSNNHASTALWLDQVHPKEYRNYLRRRELQRELVGAEQARLEAPGANFPSNGIDNNENDEDERLSLLSTATSTNMTLRSRFSAVSTATTMTTSVANGSADASFRCRICSSSTCVNRDHVIQVSQMRNALLAQRTQTLLRRTEHSESAVNGNTVADLNVNPSATHNTTATATANPPANLTQTTRNRRNIFRFLQEQPENEDDASFSLAEFFGIGTDGPASWLDIIMHASIIIGANAVATHVFLCLPYVIGLSFYKGYVWNATKSAGKIALQSSWISPELVKIAGSALAHVSDRFSSAIWSVPLATEDSFAEFCICIGLGYITLSGVMGMYIDYVGRHLKDEFHATLVPILSFLGMFLKLLLLLQIEMFTFPLLCGWIIDWTTAGLFGVSFGDRLAVFSSLPVTSTLLHWAAGAAFMMAFAALITDLRRFLRPGLLYFLRNPSDPDNHPLKEMVERPIGEQLWRLLVSLLFYGALIACSVGLFVHGTLQLMNRFLPASLSVSRLNFRFGDPLAEIPIDLFLNLALRTVAAYLKPTRLVSHSLRALLSPVIRQLRLSAYFLGRGRYLREELPIPTGGRWVVVPDFDRVYTRRRLRDMQEQHVTPVDVAQLPIRDGNNSNSSTNSNGNANNSPAASRSGSSLGKDWTVVFRPNWLGWRSCLVICVLLGWAQVLLAMCSWLPIVIGRKFMTVVLEQFALTSTTLTISSPVHEVYTWTIGMIFVLLGVKGIDWLLFGRQSRQETTRTALSPTSITRLVAKSVVVGLFVGVVWPLLAGLLLTCLLAPVLFTSQGSVFVDYDPAASAQNLHELQTTAVVFIGACWSVGFPTLRVLWMLATSCGLLSARSIEAVRRLLADGLQRLPLDRFMRDAGLPITGILALAVFGPPLLPLVFVPLFNGEGDAESLLLSAKILEWQRVAHPAALCVMVAWHMGKAAHRSLARLVATVRDDQYLVGRRLHNLEREARATGSDPSNSHTSNNHVLRSPLL